MHSAVGEHAGFCSSHGLKQWSLRSLSSTVKLKKLANCFLFMDAYFWAPVFLALSYILYAQSPLKKLHWKNVVWPQNWSHLHLFFVFKHVQQNTHPQSSSPQAAVSEEQDELLTKLTALFLQFSLFLYLCILLFRSNICCSSQAVEDKVFIGHSYY